MCCSTGCSRESVRQGRAILARPDSARYRLGKFVRRNRTAVVFSAATATALVGATAFSVVQMREATTQRREAIRAARRATAMAELQSVIGGDARDPDGRPMPLAGRIAMAERVVVRRFHTDPWLVAGLLVDLSDRHFESGDIRAQRAMLGRARSIALRAGALGEAEPGSTQQLGLTNSLAEVLRLSGRTREAVPYFRRILADLDSLGYGETEAFPNVVNFLSSSLVDLGELAALDSTLRRFIRDREAAYGEGRVPTLLAFLYARTKLRLGAIDSADVWLSRALRDTTQGAGQFEAYLAAMLRARLRRADGDPRGAPALLERELGTLLNDGQQRLTLFALPLVTAGEWRLAGGDARGADSLARLARTAAAIDSGALVRSALAGRAELLRARALRALGQGPDAREAAERAVTALANGYGPGNAWTRAARSLVDSLAK